MKSYAEKLRDPRWQKMRLKIMERDEFTCQFCRSTEETLNVHHKYYDKGAAPWEYEESALVTCCESCHENAETLKKMVSGLISGRCEMRVVTMFVTLFERDPASIDYLLSGMIEGGQKVTEALSSVTSLYYDGYADGSREAEPK